MKKTKNFLAGLLIFISLAILLLYAFKKEYLLRAAKVTYLNGHSTAFLDDYKYFENKRTKLILALKSVPVGRIHYLI